MQIKGASQLDQYIKVGGAINAKIQGQQNDQPAHHPFHFLSAIEKGLSVRYPFDSPAIRMT
jgi:hypothetical protein